MYQLVANAKKHKYGHTQFVHIIETTKNITATLLLKTLPTNKKQLIYFLY